MPNDIDITISAQDQATKGIKGIYTEIGTLNKQIKAEDQEWQKLSLTIDKAKDPVRYYTELTKHLQTQMGNLAQKETLLKAAIEQSKNAKGEDTKQTEKLRAQLSGLELQQAKTRSEINKATAVIHENSGALNRQVQFLEKNHESLTMISLAATAAFGVLAFAVKGATKESNELKNSLLGLSSIAQGTGQDVARVKDAAVALAEDGLMTVADAATSLKNLLARGFSLQEAIDIMNRFKDSAAFGRQASLSFGEAIRGATEGLKNENSILVDNAGVTKNVSKMWEDYAKAHGKSVNELSLAEKRLAEYNGILRETRFQVGDAAKLTETLSGQQAKAEAQTKLLKAALGDALEPALAGVLKHLVSMIAGLRDWIKENPQLTSSLVLAAGALTGVAALFTGVGAIIPSLVKGYQLLRSAIIVTTVAQDGLNMSMRLNPVGAVIAALGLAATAFVGYQAKIAAAKAESERLAQQKAQEQQQIVDLATKYEELTGALAKTQKGSADYKRISEQLNGTKDALAKLMPNVVTAYDNEGRAVDINTAKLKENAQAARDAIAARKRLALDEAAMAVDQAQKAMDEFIEKANKRAHSGEPMLQGMFNQQMAVLRRSLHDAIAKYTQLAEGATKATKENTGATDENTDSKKKQTEALSWQEFQLQMLDKQWQIDQATILANATETERLTAQKQYLSEKLSLLNSRLADMQAELAATTVKYGENSGEAQKVALAIMDLQVQQAQAQKQYADTTKEIEDQTKKLKELAAQAEATYRAQLGGARQAVSQGLLSYGEARAYAGSVVKQELGEEGLRAAWQAMKKEYYEATPEALANMFKWQYGVEPPKLALGGIVTGPTLAMIGERGPEAVVPLNRMPPAVNVNLTVNVNGTADRTDAYGLARQIKDILQQELRQQRLAWR